MVFRKLGSPRIEFHCEINLNTLCINYESSESSLSVPSLLRLYIVYSINK